MQAAWGVNGLLRNGMGPNGMPNGLGGLGGGLAGLGLNDYGLVGDNQALLNSIGLSNLAANVCVAAPPPLAPLRNVEDGAAARKVLLACM